MDSDSGTRQDGRFATAAPGIRIVRQRVTTAGSPAIGPVKAPNAVHTARDPSRRHGRRARTTWIPRRQPGSFDVRPITLMSVHRLQLIVTRSFLPAVVVAMTLMVAALSPGALARDHRDDTPPGEPASRGKDANASTDPGPGSDAAGGNDSARGEDRARNAQADDRAARPVKERKSPEMKDDDPRSDSAWAARERQLEVTPKDRGFTASSRSDRDGDVIVSSYAPERAELALSYDGAGASSSDRRAIRVDLDAILEFRDENGNGRYDVSEPVASRWSIRDLESTVNITPSEAGTTVRVSHAIPGNGSLSLIFHLVEVESRSLETLVLPSETKYDIVIDRYPFVQNDTLLALGTSVNAPAALAPAIRDGMPSIVTREAGRAAFYSWVPEADVDGTLTDVAWSVHTSVGASGTGSAETDGNAIVYFTYARGVTIVHDPSVGVMNVVVEAIESVLGNPIAYAAGLAFGVAIVAIVGAGRVRGRSRP